MTSLGRCVPVQPATFGFLTPHSGGTVPTWGLSPRFGLVRCAYFAGAMFWFTRKTFSGS